jgi:beta-glucosidase
MDFAHKIRETAAEGAVLLRNTNNTLPFTNKDTISIFGRCQFDYYRSGTGSGGSVHIPYATNLTEGLLNLKSLEKKCPLINGKLIDLYEDWRKTHPFNNGGGGWAAEPWNQIEMPIKPELAAEAAAVSNKAIYVIGRTAGEDQDNAVREGSWLLTQEEKDVLRSICKAFTKVTVILNVSNIIDMSWIDDPVYSGHITAVLYTWHGGMEGGNAAAELLCGTVTPSGKLTDTIAYSINDYPSSANFGNPQRNFYKEDIYVGYRYFMTFAPDKIRFPFGFGLSYTTFSVKILMAHGWLDTISVTALIRNTGKKYAGKETLQIYYEAPQGKLGKPVRILAAYGKTVLLRPGSFQLLTVSFPVTDMASYDDSGITGNKSCFVLEKGDYRIYAGTDSLSAEPIKINYRETFPLHETIITEKLEQAAGPTEPFLRIHPEKQKPDGTYTLSYEQVPLYTTDLTARIKENLPEEIPYTGDKEIRYTAVKHGFARLDSFIAQFTPKELATLVRGEGMCSRKVTPGIAAAFGGVSKELHAYGIPAGGCSDGPSGIRMDTGKEASLMPIGTLLACTWNPALITRLYTFEGKELLENKIDTLLGPGMNIHRNPLNGRNFEYFSEDPLVTGVIATAVLRGLHKGGSSGTIKHFAANNQETARHTADSIISERALREIYLRGFERAVKQGHAVSLMTSYNPLNGHWTASNYDLVNTILRKEWKYTGLVMTDWWAKMNNSVYGGTASVKNTGFMIRARNDIYMVVDNDGAAANVYWDTIPESLKNGSLTVGELQLCAKDILRFLLQAPVSKTTLRPLKPVIGFKAHHTELPPDAEIIQIGQQFLPSDNTKPIYIEINNQGIYNIFGTYSKITDKELSQSVYNIMIDDKSGASLESRGTQGALITTLAAQIRLEKGYYKISLENTKPGINVSCLNISAD